MKVAMLAPIAWRTPPRHYGPWELVTSLLTEGLVARGVEVTLFATLDSQTSARSARRQPAWLRGGRFHGRARVGGTARRDRVERARRTSTCCTIRWTGCRWRCPISCHAPMLTTVHGFSGAGILPAYARACSSYVAISEADRSPELEYLATIYHGIDFTVLPFQPLPVTGW